MNNLGLSLGRRYERTGNLQDLEAAIARTEAAARATPEGLPDRAAWFSNLGLSLRPQIPTNRRFGGFRGRHCPSGRARWAREEKDGEGFYTVDLVETFFSKIDLR